MERHELKGDWAVLSGERFRELLQSSASLTGGIIWENMRNPALRALNVEVGFPGGERTICAINIAAEEDTGEENSVLMRFFSATGNTAVFIFASSMQKDGENTKLTCGFAPGVPQNRDQAEKLSFYFFFVFNVIQFLMLHGTEKVSMRKEYRKGLRPPRSSRLSAPYTLPGKVRVLEIAASTEEIAECISRETAVHIWHCPAWGVRGHYRHYKTGRVSYVRPYVKGKNKAAYAGREYALPDGELVTEVMR